jgi:hypothetical protein
MKIKLLAALIILSVFRTGVPAASLSSTFSEVTVDNLSPGWRYSLKSLADFPYNITNKGAKPITVLLQVNKVGNMSPRAGYEIIEDTSWIKLQDTLITIMPAETKQVDVYVLIPGDKKYLGRKFEAGIWAKALDTGEGMPVTVALQSVILLSTAKEFGLTQRGMSYSVEPEYIDIGTIQAGAPYDLLRYSGKVLKIYSDSDKVQEFEVTSSNKFLTILGGPKVIVDPFQSKAVRLVVNIPDSKANRGKKFSFQVSISPVNSSEKRALMKIDLSTK